MCSIINHCIIMQILFKTYQACILKYTYALLRLRRYIDNYIYNIMKLYRYICIHIYLLIYIIKKYKYLYSYIIYDVYINIYTQISKTIDINVYLLFFLEYSGGVTLFPLDEHMTLQPRAAAAGYTYIYIIYIQHLNICINMCIFATATTLILP